jgi:hypothetical protein
VTVGAVWVTVKVVVLAGAGAVVVGAVVVGAVTVGGVAAAVRVGDETVGVDRVGAVRATNVSVPVAALLPLPPHDVSATAASTPATPDAEILALNARADMGVTVAPAVRARIIPTGRRVNEVRRSDPGVEPSKRGVATPDWF